MDKHQTLTHIRVSCGTQPLDLLLTCLPGSSPCSMESEQDPVTRAKGVRKEEQELPNLQLSENGWSWMNYNSTSGEGKRRVYLYLQDQSELDKKCYQQNLSG